MFLMPVPFSQPGSHLSTIQTRPPIFAGPILSCSMIRKRQFRLRTQKARLPAGSLRKSAANTCSGCCTLHSNLRFPFPLVNPLLG
jgi:hypothetical protein